MKVYIFSWWRRLFQFQETKTNNLSCRGYTKAFLVQGSNFRTVLWISHLICRYSSSTTPRVLLWDNLHIAWELGEVFVGTWGLDPWKRRRGGEEDIEIDMESDP